ncbi:cytochrome p450 like protein [Zymoseptoria brevis]|uniref:Cytochrome p450 like protein n=1 Tax=Zymoseptoria brevis TaxID=1047168 RepID=A0A0F4G8I4_9PEZI|nr:cytochrome p450 like protein [Zymoseptoria brevis]
MDIAVGIGLVGAVALAGVAAVCILDNGSSLLLGAHPSVGVRKELAAGLRARLRTLRKTQELIAGGYKKYTKHGLGFLLPQLTSMPLFILPANDMDEIIHAPEHQVDFFEPNITSAGVKYTLGPHFTTGPHITLVKRTLTRKLPLLVSAIDVEVQKALRLHWPMDAHTWSAVRVLPACTKIGRQVLQRTFCGPELSGNSNFLDSIEQHFKAVVVSSGVLQLSPPILRPVLAPFFRLWISRRYTACRRMMSPVIRQRLLSFHTRSECLDEPDDCIQWLLADMLKGENYSRRVDEDAIVQGLLVLNVLALHTVSMSAANVLLDLFSAPNASMYVQGLREECETALRVHKGVWTKEALDGLVRVDSTIRESLRFSPLSDVGMKRLVVDPRGVTLSSGLHVPPNVCVGAPVYSYHTDPDFYPGDPRNFDAFRSSRYREEYRRGRGVTGLVADQPQDMLKHRNMALTATSTTYLPFGHGRHACPGRFLASVILKLFLARVVSDYDVEMRGRRPDNTAITNGKLPKGDAEVWVKARAAHHTHRAHDIAERVRVA